MANSLGLILWWPRPGRFSSEVRRKWTIHTLVEISEESRNNFPVFAKTCYQALRWERNREEGSMNVYVPEIDRKMKRLFGSLGEDDRRRYAAVEATKLGHGGIKYIAKSCSAIPRPSAKVERNWKRQPIWTRAVSEKKGGGRAL